MNISILDTVADLVFRHGNRHFDRHYNIPFCGCKYGKDLLWMEYTEHTETDFKTWIQWMLWKLLKLTVAVNLSMRLSIRMLYNNDLLSYSTQVEWRIKNSTRLDKYGKVKRKKPSKIQRCNQINQTICLKFKPQLFT